MAKILSVEFGDSLIKVCVAGRSGDRLKIYDCFNFKTPDGAIVDGEIFDMPAMREEMKRQLEARKLQKLETVFVIRSGKIAAREVTVPPVKQNRLTSVIEGNAPDYFPVDTAKYQIAYQRLDDRVRGKKEEYHVMALAAPLSLLENYALLADTLGLRLKAIDNLGSSLYRCAEQVTDESVIMYINMECDATVVTFAKAGRLLLQRTLTSGCEELLQHYMEEANKASDEYVESLAEISIETPRPRLTEILDEDEISDALERFMSNISRTRDYLNSGNWSYMVEKIVLTGVCAGIDGMPERIAQVMDLPVEHPETLKGFPTLNFGSTGIRYLGCLGAIYGQVGLYSEKLLPGGRSKKKAHGEESLSFGVLVLALCVVGAAAICYMAKLDYDAAYSRKTQMEDEIASLSYVMDVRESYDRYTALEAGYYAAYTATVTQNDSLRGFLEQLESCTPSDVYIASAVFGAGGVSMNVRTDDKTSAAAFITQLQSLDCIAGATVTEMTEEEDELGIVSVYYTVVCTYDNETEGE